MQHVRYLDDTIYNNDKCKYLGIYPSSIPAISKYTVGLQATFWNMNSSVWAIWAAQAVRKKTVVFFNFLWAKKNLNFF